MKLTRMLLNEALRMGWTEVRHSGKHIVLRHPNGGTTTLPVGIKDTSRKRSNFLHTLRRRQDRPVFQSYQLAPRDGPDGDGPRAGATDGNPKRRGHKTDGRRAAGA